MFSPKQVKTKTHDNRNFSDWMDICSFYTSILLLQQQCFCCGCCCCCNSKIAHNTFWFNQVLSFIGTFQESQKRMLRQFVFILLTDHNQAYLDDSSESLYYLYQKTTASVSFFKPYKQILYLTLHTLPINP